VPPDCEIQAQIMTIRLRAARERDRAGCCNVLARRYETRMTTAAESLRGMYGRLADLYRSVESRHLLAADLHDLLAARMEGWRDRADRDLHPVLMTAVASMLGSSGAVATLGRPARAAAVVAASDANAQASHDLELVMAEGPATDAARGMAVAAAGLALVDRWPRYGPAAAELGIRAVRAAPLEVAGAQLGALCVMDSSAQAAAGAATTIGVMASALSQILLGSAGGVGPDQGLVVAGLLGKADTQAVVHQAIGMISVHCRCGVDVAFDLLAARAFADGKPVAEIAQQVVRGETALAIG
jgi:hypothetical protein